MEIADAGSLKKHQIVNHAEAKTPDFFDLAAALVGAGPVALRKPGALPRLNLAYRC